MELWKDICGYEGQYQVSNLGRVKRLERLDTNNHRWAEKILKQTVRNGYLAINISVNGTVSKLAVHRLVAQAFCLKADGCNIVNHIDNNPQNNRAENLEWTTYKGNMQHASKQGRMKANAQAYINMANIHERRKVPVIATDKNGKTYYFASQTEAAKSLNIRRSHISAACRKEYGYKTLGGYSFQFADDERAKNALPHKIGRSKEQLREESRQRMIGNTLMVGRHLSEEHKEKLRKNNAKKVLQYSKDGTFIAEYASTQAVLRELGINVSACVRGITKTAGNYFWKYKEEV